jgi:GNAT superfamily N-acetyltransferase
LEFLINDEKKRNMVTKYKHTIRQPVESEIDELTALAMKSKSYWGYDYTFMRSCVEELTVTKEHVNHHTIYLAESKKQLIGFYVLQEIDSDSIEMTFMFVDPVHIGTGLGKLLFNHAVGQAKRAGYGIIIIQSDPFASAFYEKMGCIKIGKKASGSIPGRDLPLYEYKIPA